MAAEGQLVPMPPRRPAKVRSQATLSLYSDTYQQIMEAARRENMTLGEYVSMLVERFVNHD